VVNTNTTGTKTNSIYNQIFWKIRLEVETELK